MFLYYITDRKQLSAESEKSIPLLLERIRLAADAGVNAIQLREKDLRARELLSLALRAMQIVNEANANRPKEERTQLLVNSRVDVALASGCDGVHLRSDDILPADARAILLQKKITQPIIGVSCHNARELQLAGGHGADFAVFGPVFGKGDLQEVTGTKGLTEACTSAANTTGDVPVLALGGVTLDNAAACLNAGAAGVAAIRMFQNGDVYKTVSRLRSIDSSGSP